MNSLLTENPYHGIAFKAYARGQKDALQEVVRWLESHKVDWFDDDKGNVSWVQMVSFTVEDWEALKTMGE
jgi:hypothetical protein